MLRDVCSRERYIALFLYAIGVERNRCVSRLSTETVSRYSHESSNRCKIIANVFERVGGREGGVGDGDARCVNLTRGALD